MGDLSNSTRICSLDMSSSTPMKRRGGYEAPTQQLERTELAQFTAPSRAAGVLDVSCSRISASPGTELDTSVRAPSTAAAADDEEDALKTAMRELESLQISLVEERQKNAQLIEEKRVAEANHQRDIETLEGMLQAVIEQKDELIRELAEYKAQAVKTADDITKFNVNTIKESEEPEMEPRRA